MEIQNKHLLSELFVECTGHHIWENKSLSYEIFVRDSFLVIIFFLFLMFLYLRLRSLSFICFASLWFTFDSLFPMARSCPNSQTHTHTIACDLSEKQNFSVMFGILSLFLSIQNDRSIIGVDGYLYFRLSWIFSTSVNRSCRQTRSYHCDGNKTVAWIQSTNISTRDWKKIYRLF